MAASEKASNGGDPGLSRTTLIAAAGVLIVLAVCATLFLVWHFSFLQQQEVAAADERAEIAIANARNWIAGDSAYDLAEVQSNLEKALGSNSTKLAGVEFSLAAVAAKQVLNSAEAALDQEDIDSAIATLREYLQCSGATELAKARDLLSQAEAANDSEQILATLLRRNEVELLKTLNSGELNDGRVEHPALIDNRRRIIAKLVPRCLSQLFGYRIALAREKSRELASQVFANAQQQAVLAATDFLLQDIANGKDARPGQLGDEHLANLISDLDVQAVREFYGDTQLPTERSMLLNMIEARYGEGVQRITTAFVLPEADIHNAMTSVDWDKIASVIYGSSIQRIECANFDKDQLPPFFQGEIARREKVGDAEILYFAETDFVLEVRGAIVEFKPERYAKHTIEGVLAADLNQQWQALAKDSTLRIACVVPDRYKLNRDEDLAEPTGRRDIDKLPIFVWIAMIEEATVAVDFQSPDFLKLNLITRKNQGIDSIFALLLENSQQFITGTLYAGGLGATTQQNDAEQAREISAWAQRCEVNQEQNEFTLYVPQPNFKLNFSQSHGFGEALPEGTYIPSVLDFRSFLPPHRNKD